MAVTFDNQNMKQYNPQTRHIIWIFDAAYQYFKERLVELEIEIMRHEHHKDLSLPPSVVTKTRAQRLEECNQAYDELKDICQFCLDAKNKAVDKSAEEFAKWFRPSV